VGPEVAELLDLPQATVVRRSRSIPPRARSRPSARRITASRPSRDRCPRSSRRPKDIAAERFPTRAERQAAAEKPIATVTLADLGVDPALVGSDGSPTWVAGVDHVDIARSGELISGDDPATLAARLRAAA
jgi:electron transfer flavoprotein beta subunit